jgi:hypothetical protein
MSTPTTRNGIGLVGAGAAACAVCCAGPILGVLAAGGVASLLGAVILGVAGLLAVVAVSAVLWQRRRRRQQRCVSRTGPEPVDAPQLEVRS